MRKRWTFAFALVITAMAIAALAFAARPAPNLPDSIASAAISGPAVAAPDSGAPSGLPLNLLPTPLPLPREAHPGSLTVSPRADGGWEIQDPNGPYGSLYAAWDGAGHAIFDWMHTDGGAVTGDSNKLYRIDLNTGTLELLTGYHEAESARSGGPLVTLMHNRKFVVVDTRTLAEVWEVPDQTNPVGWLGPNWLLLDQWLKSGGDAELVADFEAGKLWQLPASSYMSTGLGNHFCYAHHDETKPATVTCFEPATGKAVAVLQPEEQAPGFIQDFWADAARRRMAFGYRRPNPAQAAKPEPLEALHIGDGVWSRAMVDTLALYDAETGAIVRWSLPREGEIHSLSWSADGTYIGFQLLPKKQRFSLKAPAGEVWVLKVASGGLKRLLTYDRQAPPFLMRMQADGSAVVTRGKYDKPTLELVAYGKPTVPWQPGLEPDFRYGPQTARRIASKDQPYTLLNDERLDLHLLDGTVASWNLSSPILIGTAYPDPTLRWVYLRPHNGNNLYFLRR